MSSTFRLLQLLAVFCRYRLDRLLPRQHLPLAARLILSLGPWRLFPQPKAHDARRLREALQHLGPIFIKFGQVLSTRPDLIPAELARELAKLQDQVPPFPGPEARARIAAELGHPLNTAFSAFNETPLASASIAQVHAAQLPDGREAVVKVVRPGVDRIIRRDTRLLKRLAASLERLWPESRRLHPVDVVRDYELTLFDELDMMKEASNTSQLRRNFANSKILYVPEVHWDWTRKHVLVMERVSGIPVADTQALDAAGVNREKLAERGVEIFFTQVFRDSFFHADMHPGNIFVDARNPEDPRYIAIDCGIMGSLSPEDQSYLARNLLAFFKQDYRQVAQLHIDSGWIPAHTRVNEFEAAIRSACEPFFNRPLKDISFGQFLVRLLQTAQRFDMEVQPQLVLLQKTLLNIEGLGRQLHPELDLWSTGLPYLERWMRDRMAPPGLLRSLQKHLPQWVEQSPDMPGLIHQALERIADKPADKAPLPPTAPKSNTLLWSFGLGALGAGMLLSREDWLLTLHQQVSDLSWEATSLLIVGAILCFTASRR